MVFHGKGGGSNYHTFHNLLNKFYKFVDIELFQPFQYNHQRVSERSDKDNRLGCSGTGR